MGASVGATTGASVGLIGASVGTGTGASVGLMGASGLVDGLDEIVGAAVGTTTVAGGLSSLMVPGSVF